MEASQHATVVMERNWWICEVEPIGLAGGLDWMCGIGVKEKSDDLSCQMEQMVD